MLSLIRLTAAIAALGLAACGGGGGKSSSSASAPSSSPVTSSAGNSQATSVSSVTSLSSSSSDATTSSAISSIATSSNSSLSSVSLSSSSTASMISVQIDGTITAFDEAGQNIALNKQQVTVELLLLDANEQPLDTATPDVSDYSSSTELRFSADLTATGATSVALNISAPGHTSYARKLSPESKIAVEAKLQRVPVQTVVPSTATTASGVTLSGFNIQVSASDEQQSNALLINIPQSLLPEDTDSLEVAVRTFDPNEPDDAEFFPGAYADSDGNQLASVGFNFAEIKTNANEPVSLAMRKARQQKLAKLGGNQKTLAEEPVTINYQIPPQSCKLLESLGDSAPDMTGFQVPVYTYNSASGLWDLIGQGTLYNATGQQVAANQTQFNCDIQVFTLEIVVTNEIFLREWWNLDYPLNFSQPAEYCALLQLKNPEGQSLDGVSGYVTDNDGTFNFASSFFTTDTTGSASIRVAQSSLNPDLEAEVIFFNSGEFGYLTHKLALTSNCANPPLQVIELSRPKLCEVSGKFVFENGRPVTRNLVYGFSSQAETEYFAFDFTSSNTQGDYRLNLPCGGEYDIFNFAALLSGGDARQQLTRIDGNQDADEQSDDGSRVVMKTQTVQQTAPLVTGSYSVERKQLNLIFYGQYDAFPMNANITVKRGDNGEVVDSFTTQINADVQAENEEFTYYYLGSQTLTRDWAVSNFYLLSVTLEDGLGKTWTEVTGLVYQEDLEE